MDIRVGDRLKLKKPHPCGSYLWLTLRIGMDFRVRCEGCGAESRYFRRGKIVEQLMRGRGRRLRCRRCGGSRFTLLVRE